MAKASRKPGCPLCTVDKHVYLFSVGTTRLDRCTNCGLVFQVVMSADHGLAIQPPSVSRHTESATEREAARDYLKLLLQRDTGKSILLVSASEQPFKDIAVAEGFTVEHFSPDSKQMSSLPEGYFDSAVILYSLHKTHTPAAFLEQIHRTLKPNGALLIAIPVLDSWAARFFKNLWIGWHPTHYCYFDTLTIQSLLLRTGFNRIRTHLDQRLYSVHHLRERLQDAQQTLLTGLAQSILRLLPSSSVFPFKLATSGLVIIAQCYERRERPLLSVVMPVFNECNTVQTTLEAVLAKEVPGMDKEVLVVESNSSDGTREIVQRYENHSQVRLILEERPGGKGHAVRAALALAQGDYVLIQDADQEYDVNDYDNLIEPLRTYQAAFVLGSRHSRDGWKIRDFTAAPELSWLYNFGHVLFGTALNRLYNQHLKDPFTMYKVFRRDCLYGLQFDSNRFDFDFEIVIKLIRKGYTPLEIPVNYKARSFQEGKKVSTFRDPLTWIRALIKYRVVPLFPGEK